jgi:hypothetical protein
MIHAPVFPSLNKSSCRDTVEISLSSIYTDINPIRMKRIPEDYIFRIQKFALIYNSVEVLKP